MSEQPGERVTLRAIAQKLGVSRMTVSRALRQHPAVAGATAERIRRVARQLGYRPDPNLARVMEATRRGRLRWPAGVLRGFEFNSAEPAPTRHAFQTTEVFPADDYRLL